MIGLSLTLYRFICDVSTFTSLFHEDQEHRCIPDSSSFHCCWTVVPRAKQSTINPAHAETDGRTSSTFFQSTNEGADMALNFSSARVNLALDAEADVVSFYLKPSEYHGGDLPVIAKGTLDPTPYMGKPKKNYAIKLRDASGEVIGKLLFSLKTREPEPEPQPQRAAPNALTAPQSTSVPRRRASSERERSSDTNLPPPASSMSSTQTASLSPPAAPPVEPPRMTATAVSRREPDATVFHHPPELQRRDSAPTTTSVSPPQRAKTASRDASPHTKDGSSPLTQQIDLVLERVFARLEHIDLDHPAPFVLGGEYYIKLRYSSSFTYYTADVVCTTPKEIMFNTQRVCVTLLPNSAEKLRFSLWENKKQVAGFSLDPSKFKMPAAQWKEYSIPFRYFPTQQGASLDVTVRRRDMYLPLASEKEEPPVIATPAVPAPLPATAAPRLGSAEKVEQRVSPPRVTRLGDERKPSPPKVMPVVEVAEGKGSAPLQRIQRGETAPRTSTAPTSAAVPPPLLGGTRGGGLVGEQGRERRSDASTSSGAAEATAHQVTAAAPTPPTAVHAPVHQDAKGLPYRRFPSTDNSGLSPQATPNAPPVQRPPPVTQKPDPGDSTFSFSASLYTELCRPIPTFAERQSALRREQSPLPRPVPSTAKESKKNAIVVLSPLKVQEQRPFASDYVARRASPPRVPTEGMEVPTLTQHQVHRECEVAAALGAAPVPHTESAERQRATPLRSQLPRDRDNSLLRHSSVPKRGVAEASAAATAMRGEKSNHSSSTKATGSEANAHERYMAEVMARIDKQQSQIAARPVNRVGGLADEWHSWREERANSRDNSVVGRGSRSNSVRSRDDSVSSICSRRASSPLPTKSFADQATQKPYQPEYRATPHRTSSRKGSLIPQRL